MNDQSLNDDDMTTSKPTEDQDDRDTGSTSNQDTGDLPTERSDDRDAGGEGQQDTGDEA